MGYLWPGHHEQTKPAAKLRKPISYLMWQSTCRLDDVSISLSRVTSMLFTGSKRTGYFLNKNVNFVCLSWKWFKPLLHYNAVYRQHTFTLLPLAMTLNISYFINFTNKNKGKSQSYLTGSIMSKRKAGTDIRSFFSKQKCAVSAEKPTNYLVLRCLILTPLTASSHLSLTLTVS